jgi:hypothetical protein
VLAVELQQGLQQLVLEVELQQELQQLVLRLQRHHRQ